MSAGGGWGKELLHESVVGEYTLGGKLKNETRAGLQETNGMKINVTLPLHMPIHHSDSCYQPPFRSYDSHQRKLSYIGHGKQYMSKQSDPGSSSTINHLVSFFNQILSISTMTL